MLIIRIPLIAAFLFRRMIIEMTIGQDPMVRRYNGKD